MASRAETLAKSHTTGPGTMERIAKRLSDESAKLSRQAGDCQRLSAEMHAALSAENWSVALSAPTRSWLSHRSTPPRPRRDAERGSAVGMDVTQLYRGGPRGGFVSLDWNRSAGRNGRHSTHASRSHEDDTVAGNETPQRALLWLDAVGGFLVCLDDCVVLGQPAGGDRIAVPIMADVSRRHAVIRREAGTYVLEPLHRTRVDGREIKAPFVLADNQLIELGDNVRCGSPSPMH